MRWELVPFAVVLLAMAWRVWRLEGRAKDIEYNAEWLLGCVQDRAHKEGVSAVAGVAGDTKRSLGLLATALGYEWKRTEAKEGWEKRPATMTAADAIAAVKADVAYGAPYFSCSSIRRVGYIDRRVSDRRKPALAKKARKR